jgi:hypothetical protein
VKKIIFVSDFFVEDYKGGAELTTEALIKCSPREVIKINSANVSEQLIQDYSKNLWIICNFSQLEDNLKIKISKNLNYSIIEYDYKFCDFRSIEKHKQIKNTNCDCIKKGLSGKVNQIFYGYAQYIWYMSKKQKNIFINHVSTIKNEKCKVLSSVFDDGDLRFINSIKDNKKNSKWIILNSNSWIKGTQETIQYAKNNNLDYEVIQGLPYHELLIKLSTSKGLIFMPLGGDTCPRLVIEARLLGCKLVLNDNVQHKDEKWFSDSVENCFSYLLENKNQFWSFYE